LGDKSASLDIRLLPVTSTLTPRTGVLGRAPLEALRTLNSVGVLGLESRICCVGEWRTEVAKLCIHQRGSRRSKDI